MVSISAKGRSTYLLPRGVGRETDTKPECTLNSSITTNWNDETQTGKRGEGQTTRQGYNEPETREGERTTDTKGANNPSIPISHSEQHHLRELSRQAAAVDSGVTTTLLLAAR